jgi:hypothetical protein
VKKLLYVSVMELNDNERLLTKNLHSNDQPWTDIVDGDRRPNIWWAAVSAMFLFIYFFFKGNGCLKRMLAKLATSEMVSILV